MLLFGPIEEARSILEVFRKSAEGGTKADVSLRTLEEPLFGPEDEVDEKLFFPVACLVILLLKRILHPAGWSSFERVASRY